MAIIVADSIIIFSDLHNKPSSTFLVLNITAATASSLGIIAVYRHGFHGVHGRSYLFLTLGIISWFAADLTLAYYYFALGIEEQVLVSFTDILWFIGYLFLAAHLFTVLGFVRSNVKLITVVLTSIATLSFIIYIVIDLFSSSHFHTAGDFTAFVVTIIYPILDLMLFVPSSIILVSVRKDDIQSIPWILSSLALLINAIADEGYLIDYQNGLLQHLLFWNIFYVTDFIFMAGALFWYNKFHISPERRKIKLTR